MLKFKQLALATLAAALLIPTLAVVRGQAAAPGPSVDKASLIVWLTKRGLCYSKPGVSDDKHWCWLPYMDLNVNGPIESGTQFVVEYWAGKTPWLTFELNAEPQPAGGTYHFDRVGAMASDEKATGYTGPVVVTIRAVNELSGLNQWLYKGTLNVKKYLPLDPKKFPLFKEKYDYYVDQDWRMPFGTLTGNWYASTYTASNLNTTPTLTAKMWFRGDSETIDNKTDAYLYYQDKVVGRAKGDARTWKTTEPSNFNWSEVNFTFTGSEQAAPVFFYDTSGGAGSSSAFVLYNNPGDYEIKVLHNGTLSRSMKFSVNAQGVVDNGFSTQLAAPGRWTFPVKVLAQTDGKWDAKAWQTGAFYGNPLTGFRP